MTVLITGIAGHIGSATAAEFLLAGHKVIGVDNLSGKNSKSIKMLKKYFEVDFCEVDVKDYEAMLNIFKQNNIDVVFHFAATSAENFTKTDNLLFYENNVINLFKLLKAMQESNTPTLIYPSSIFAELGLDADSPYVRTKIAAENMIEDFADSNEGFNYGILRYCHVAGYYSKVFLGEFEYYSIMKNAARVACGKIELGRDFTYDEYYRFVHIDDVAEFNLKIAEELHANGENVMVTVASKDRISVVDLIKTFEELSGNEVNLTVALKNEKINDESRFKLIEHKLKYSIKDICKNQLDHESHF